jgi:hypothetical protein
VYINWQALGEVAVVSVGVSVGVVAIFTFGVLALSYRQIETGRGGTGTIMLTGALLCFAACAAIVLYGLYLIIPQLHQ